MTNNKAQSMLIGKRGVELGTLDDLLRYAEHLSRSELCPAQFRGKAADLAVAIEYGLELGMSPLTAGRSIYVVHGRTALEEQASLALCRAHPDWEDGFITWEGEPDTDDFAAVYTIKRKGETQQSFRFSLRDAKRAGLNNPNYRKFPANMCGWRAVGLAIKFVFPDAVKGTMMVGEAASIPKEPAREVEVLPADLPQPLPPPAPEPQEPAPEPQKAPEVAAQEAYDRLQEPPAPPPKPKVAKKRGRPRKAKKAPEPQEPDFVFVAAPPAPANVNEVPGEAGDRLRGLVAEHKAAADTKRWLLDEILLCYESQKKSPPSIQDLSKMNKEELATELNRVRGIKK